MQKWGKNRNGSTRFRCKFCQINHTRKRIDLTKKHRLKLFKKWLLGKRALTEICLDHSVNRKTLTRWLAPFWDIEPQPKQVNISGKTLIIDGKYLEKFATVLVASTSKAVVSWHFTQRENHASWLTFLNTLRYFPSAIVCDGQRGMIKAINERFPQVIIQRCQFHVISYCLSKLTKNPEYAASIELRELVHKIARVKTKDDLKNWLADYKGWWLTHRDFVKEKTYSETQTTPTGRRKWHYTHGRLHAAHSHLKNAIPNLFKYLKHPQMPNTTNFVEGAVNATLQEKLRFHRGLNLPKRRVLIAYHLQSLQQVF